jgi:hypothetical protein
VGGRKTSEQDLRQLPLDVLFCFSPAQVGGRMSQTQIMTLSDSSLDDAELAAIRADLDHDLGYAVLCQSPDDGFSVLEFAAIVTPDAAVVDDAQYTSVDLADVDDLDGIVQIYAVSELSTAGRYEVTREVGARQLPLGQLDEDLAGPVSPGSSSRLWTPGSAENYPLYEVRRCGDELFEMAP